MKTNIMNDTQKQIIRQSSLKSAVEWVTNQPRQYSLTELIGITMGFEEYCSTGSFDIIQKVEKKLNDNLEVSN
jgi:hypothetical protein